MKTPWQVFEVTDELKQNLRRRLAKKEAIFSIASDPLVSSLCSCLGIQSEMGSGMADRLSTPLGLEKETNWKSEVISYQGQIGLRLWVPGLSEIKPIQPDFGQILHPLSLDQSGSLSQVVLFPDDIARKYAKKGFELVIVRDWVMSSALSEEKVPYIQINTWEIAENSAMLQSELMNNKQIAFSGTHDLTDHLLGGDRKGFDRSALLFQDVKKAFDKYFSKPAKNIDLMISYVLGVVLDDLAQPAQYGSKKHEKLAYLALDFLEELQDFEYDLKKIEIPMSLHALVHAMRKEDSNIEDYFKNYAYELIRRAAGQATTVSSLALQA